MVAKGFMGLPFLKPLYEVRLRQYPQGCGKGHDTAVLGAWLGDELQAVDLASLEVSCPT